MRGIATLALILLGAAAAAAEDYVFENDLAKLTLADDGFVVGLVDKSSGRQCVAAKQAPFAAIRRRGKREAATALLRRGDTLQCRFGSSGISAELRITARGSYFVVELLKIHGGDVQEVQMAALPTRIAEHVGPLLNVQWNGQFRACVMGLSDRVHAVDGTAVVYPEFGMEGEKAALIAAPAGDFFRVIQQVERDCALPSPTLGGQWAKTSDDVRRGYLFIDLTAANVDDTIRLAKLGGFKYILIYSNVWSTSLGSYPINTHYFPGGEEGLKATIDKCHAAGLKVGMHMLTSFVGKNDPLVRPRPDPRLLKDRQTALAVALDATAKEIFADDRLTGWPSERSLYGASNVGLELQIDDEIIQYETVGGPDGRTFLRCVRGANGTRPAAHSAGAKIGHLAQRYGNYLVDLRTSLKDQLAERIAGLINRCGFDMIYFDGGECNDAMGPSWYWVSQQQMAVWQRLRREVLVQGSGTTPWTWHVFARGCCDDYASVAPKQYLDYHKIADSWRSYTASFLPAELGWWGFLADAPDQPATSPDEVEHYAIRMLGLNCPVSLETLQSGLRSNGRSEELLRLLGDYEAVRLSDRVPAEIRQKLQQGEWHMISRGGRHGLSPVRYDNYRAAAPGAVDVFNPFAAQPLTFRLQAVPTLTPIGDKANIVLLRPETPAELKRPAANAVLPGAQVARVEFGKAVAEQVSDLLVGPRAQLAAAESGKGLDLQRHRALAVRLRVDGPVSAASAANRPCPVLNVQLESTSKTYRDYYLDLDFSGQKTFILAGPTPERMLPELRPSPANYSFKQALRSFNFRSVTALNFRWMRWPKNHPVRCWVSLVEALAEGETHVSHPQIALGGARITLPAELKTGDYVEFWGEGPLRIFNANGVTLQTVTPRGQRPSLAAGANRIELAADSPGPLKLTLITLGEPLIW